MPKNKAMTLRFYDNCLQDMRALRKINEYRKYGCNSSRDLIIKAINAYENSDKSFSEQELIFIAEQIASRLSVSIPAIGDKANIQTAAADGANEENLSKALEFMMAMGGE